MTDSNLTGGQQIRELLDRVPRTLAARRAVSRHRARGAGRLGRPRGGGLPHVLDDSRPSRAGAIAVLCGRVRWPPPWPGVSGGRAHPPTEVQVARFIEEREPSLDDRLVSAVDLLRSAPESETPGLAGPMVADAARRASNVEPSAVVSDETLRRAGFQAAAAALSAGGDRRSSPRRRAAVVRRAGADALPVAGHARGHARQRAHPARHAARDRSALLGNRAPVVARVLSADADRRLARGWT